MSRKQSRELAFRLLFALAFDNGGNNEVLSEASLDSALLGEKRPDDVEMSYIKKLVNAVADNVGEIDRVIKEKSKGFIFDRIFRTDLTALRMGFAEIKFMDGTTPPVVVVNEVVEIAKKYGTEKSGGFVNGILATAI